MAIEGNIKTKPAIDKITINLDIEKFSIKGLRTKIPKMVNTDAIKPNKERNS